MRPQRKVFLAAIVLVQAWVAVPSVTAFQRFTDEAGVVIYTVLKLRGENLVGATVKYNVPGIDVKPYAGKAKSVEIPLTISGSVPPGEIVMEVTTPIGTTTAKFKVTEFQIGGGAPTRRESGQKVISTSAPTNCPEGMVGVGAERGGFCIEIDQSFTSDYRKSAQACAIEGKRRCDAAEWKAACEQT